jgi:O-antigen ligase
MNNATNTADHSGNIIAPRSAYIWIWALSALPAITAWLSFSPSGDFSYAQLVVRQFWLPSYFFELATIILAISSGLSIQKEWLALHRSTKFLMSVWLLSVFVATALAEFPSAAMLSLVSWMTHALFAISLFYLFRLWRNIDQFNVVAAFSNAIPLGATAYVLTIAIFMTVVGISADFDWVSSQPGFPHIRHSGYFLMTAMALSTAMIATRSGRQRVLHTVLLAVSFGFAIWIGSRGPLIAYFAMLAGSMILFRPMRNARTLGHIALAVVAATVLSQAFPTPDHSAFNVISRFLGLKLGTVEELSSSRTEFWRQTWHAIVANPIIGHGGNQFRLQVPIAGANYNHPHDSIFQFAYDWGVIGAASLLALLGQNIIKMCRIAVKDSNRLLGSFLVVISMAGFSLIDGVFYYNLPIMLFLTCAAAILASSKPQPAY